MPYFIDLSFEELRQKYPELNQFAQSYEAACNRAEKAEAQVSRLTDALNILKMHNPIHNDWESYLYDVAEWGLGERDEKPEWKEPNRA